MLYWRAPLHSRALLHQRLVELTLGLTQRNPQHRAIPPGVLGEGAQPSELLNHDRMRLAKHHRLFGAQSTAS